MKPWSLISSVTNFKRMISKFKTTITSKQLSRFPESGLFFKIVFADITQTLIFQIWPCLIVEPSLFINTVLIEHSIQQPTPTPARKKTNNLNLIFKWLQRKQRNTEMSQMTYRHQEIDTSDWTGRKQQFVFHIPHLEWGYKNKNY